MEFLRSVDILNNDSSVREYEIFLERDYKALVTRLHNMRHEACDKVSKRNFVLQKSRIA